MCLKMFHRLLPVGRRFLKRLRGIFKYIFDYKIILFSLLYIIMNSCVIFLLRNIFSISSIGWFFPAAFLILFVLVHFFQKKQQGKLLENGKSRKGRGERIVKFFVLLEYVFLVGIFSLCRNLPIISNEAMLFKNRESFTQGFINVKVYISEEIEERHKDMSLTVTLLEDLEMGGKILPKSSTKLLLKLPNFYSFEIGQVCQVEGYLTLPENFDDFNYERYLANKKIFFLMDNPKIFCKELTEERKGNFLRNVLVDFKMKMVGYVDEVLNEPQSSLLVGILFGQKRLFSAVFDDATRLSGVSHIISASGYNVTILTIAINKLLFFLPKRAKVIVGLIVIWLYCILSGLSTSIVRATIMGSVSMIAMLLGRNTSIHLSIPFVSFLFVLLNPMAMTDVGFLLSVSALLGLVYLLPILTSFREKIFKKAVFLDEYVLPTLSCTLATLPVLILTFKTFTIWSVLVNAIILPIVESTMLFGFLAIFFYILFKPFSYILFSVINVQLKCFEMIVMFVKNLGFGQFEIESKYIIPFALLLILCFVVVTIYFYPLENEKYNYYLKDT